MPRKKAVQVSESASLDPKTTESTQRTASTVVSPYQVFEPLSDEAYAALRHDIDKNGIRVPVEVDEAGNILDGHNRAAIAKELGKECPTRLVPIKTEQEKMEHAIKVNLLRRHVGPLA